MIKMVLLIIVSILPIAVFAFPVTLSEGIRKNTREILKSKTEEKEIHLVVNSKLVEKCKSLGRVATSKVIEHWEKRKSCEVRIESLKKEASFIKANTLFVNIQEYGCDGKTMVGEAYFCDQLPSGR